eukprot:8882371-Alexandrium_andersonii.AAC.1
MKWRRPGCARRRDWQHHQRAGQYPLPHSVPQSLPTPAGGNGSFPQDVSAPRASWGPTPEAEAR